MHVVLVALLLNYCGERKQIEHLSALFHDEL